MQIVNLIVTNIDHFLDPAAMWIELSGYGWARTVAQIHDPPTVTARLLNGETVIVLRPDWQGILRPSEAKKGAGGLS